MTRSPLAAWPCSCYLWLLRRVTSPRGGPCGSIQSSRCDTNSSSRRGRATLPRIILQEISGALRTFLANGSAAGEESQKKFENTEAKAIMWWGGATGPNKISLRDFDQASELRPASAPEPAGIRGPSEER